MDSKLLILCLSLVLATIINIIFKRFKISHIIGYILTGAIIANIFDLRPMSSSVTFEVISEFGIVFLMFSIGLEITFDRLKRMKNTLIIDGFFQIFLSSLVVYLLCVYAFSLKSTEAIIISLAFSLSSTAIVLSFLKQSKEIYAAYGRKSTAILIFQDLAVIPILLMIGFLSKPDISISQVLLETTISAVIVLALLLILGRRIMNWLLQFSARSKLEELFIASVLSIIIAASLLAHKMGFTYSLGAFIAGMIIAETKYHYKVEADIAPFKDLLLGIFFFSVGMKINFVFFLYNFFYILGVLLIVMLLKGLFIYLLLRINSTKVTSLKSALILSEIGEFAFGVFTLAQNDHLISQDLSQFLVLVVVLSLVITPFLVTNINQISAKIIKEKILINDKIQKLSLQNHIIVCGFGIIGELAAQELKTRGLEYVIISNNIRQVKSGLRKKEKIYFGNISKIPVLEALNIKEAAAVLVTLENEDKKRIICEEILQYNPFINLIVKIANLREKELLSDLPIHSLIDGKEEIAKMLVNETSRCDLSASLLGLKND